MLSRPFRLGVLLTPAAILPVVTGSAVADPVIVYARNEAAIAIHDGGPRVAGLRTAHRQAPAAEDPRYPVQRRVGKVNGRELAAMDATGMAQAIRAQLRQRDIGDLVAVDEVSAGDFTPERLAVLRQALDLLGADAQKVVFYVAPGTVQQVGRADRRYPLPPALQDLVATLTRGGHAYLLLYHGDRTPFGRDDMARDLTGWSARWPADRAASLHLMTGPEQGVGQAEIWRRVRASPAGRALLRTGPAVYGLGTGADGLRWLAQYRTYLADPDAPPSGGDARIPTGGGLVLAVPPVMRPGGRFGLTLQRPGRAVVQLVPAGGSGRRIATAYGPSAQRVRLPQDIRPGAYTLRVTLLGDGLRDVATAAVAIRRAAR